MSAAAGGCHCGAVRYTLGDAPIFVNACHCRDCQRLTGSAFALNGLIEAILVRVAAGAPAVAVDASGSRAWRCDACGVLLWAEHPLFGDAALFVRLGTLDAGEVFAPDAHFFVRSRHPWVALPPGVPAFETLPGSDGTGAAIGPARQARMDALTSAAGREPSRG